MDGPTDSAAQARLTVSRISADDVKQRQVIVKLDGEWIGDLLHGKRLSRAIAPGHHSVRVDNTWNKKTFEFDARPGEHIQLSTVNRAGRFTWFLVAAIGAGPMYVSISRDE